MEPTGEGRASPPRTICEWELIHMRTFVLSSSLVIAVLSMGCDRKPSSGQPSSPPSSDAPKHDEQGGHDHAGEHAVDARAGHGDEIVELGTTTIGSLSVRATRDRGEIKAGADAPIDVWVTTSDGKPATPIAVRLWIGTENAKGSMKAKAEIEDPKQVNHWHTHAEISAPLQDGAKLWVELEFDNGKKLFGSFDLKQ